VNPFAVFRAGAAAAVLAVLAGCGGGGGSSSSGGPPPTNWTLGIFPASTSFAAKCAAPRSGTDPVTHAAYPDRLGTATDENNFLRSWTNELYLWYTEVPDLDPSAYTTANYFPLLKTSATTTSGNPKDKFHFTLPTSQWESFSQSGVTVGYGVDFEIIQDTPPRNVEVGFTEPLATGPAATLARGASVQAIDGVSIDATDTAGINTLNAGLQPANSGEQHTFTVQDLGSASSRTITLTASAVTETPVPVVQTLSTASGNVGYILFNDHIATSEQGLFNAFTTLANAGVTDLVLDIRYNGGGYLDIASEVAYMIAGSQSAGHTFELTQFNDKHTQTDPVSGQPITPTPFHSTTGGFSVTAGQALPTLNLSKVYVLTGSGTCSASESIINGLRGIGVQVIQIGSTTCGKPYGFYPQDNCGTTYFSIQFRGINDQGFGDYPDGFSPNNTTASPGVLVPGCSVADDFTHALGDSNEARVSAALGYRVNGAASCPAASGFGRATVKQAREPSPGLTVRSPLRENRILTR
jgi:C-terminal processing protease CtpA/Prc